MPLSTQWSFEQQTTVLQEEPTLEISTSNAMKSGR